MISDRSIEVGSCRVGYEIKGKLGEFVDGTGYVSVNNYSSTNLRCEMNIPSFGSATASEAFLSSLMESSSPAN